MVVDALLTTYTFMYGTRDEAHFILKEMTAAPFKMEFTFKGEVTTFQEVMLAYRICDILKDVPSAGSMFLALFIGERTS